MAKRFQTNTRGPFKKKHLFLILLILITLISIQGFIFVEKNLEPALKEIAKTYVKRLATLTINDAISKKINEDLQDSKEVIKFERDKDGKITLITFDQSQQARILTLVTERANRELMALMNEPIQIPMGQALNSNILAQLGPKVPITLLPMGSAKADIGVRLSEAGINVVTIMVYLKIEVDVRIVIPFASDEAVVSTELPIDFIVLPGEVPNVYVKNSDGNISPLSIPITKTDLE